MRPLLFAPALAVLLAAAPARAQALPAGSAAPVTTGSQAPPAPPAAEAHPRSTALAVAIEALSPVGAAGCFYRRRYLAGALVAAGTLISGGMLLHGLARHDRDEIGLNAAAYGLTRLIGVVAAAWPDAPAGPAPPPPEPSRAAALPAVPSKSLGLSYGLSF